MRYRRRIFERIPTKTKPGKTHFATGLTQRQLITGYGISLIQESYHKLHKFIIGKTILGILEESIIDC